MLYLSIFEGCFDWLLFIVFLHRHTGFGRCVFFQKIPSKKGPEDIPENGSSNMLYWIQHDVRQTVMGIARHSIAVTNLYKILTENLYMRRICAHCVPRLLTDQSLRVAALRTFVRRWRAEGDFLHRMITTDGTCILYIIQRPGTYRCDVTVLIGLGFEQNVYAP